MYCNVKRDQRKHTNKSHTNRNWTNDSKKFKEKLISCCNAKWKIIVWVKKKWKKEERKRSESPPLEEERTDSEMRWYEFLTMTPFSKVKTNSLFDYSSFLLASSLIKALSLQKKNPKKKQQKEFTISFYYVFNSLAHEHNISAFECMAQNCNENNNKKVMFLKSKNLYTPKVHLIFPSKSSAWGWRGHTLNLSNCTKSKLTKFRIDW